MKNDDDSSVSGDYRKRLGARGEEAAAAFLEDQGFTILDMNWTCRYGEIDIIALDGDCLVFVEVKLRSGGFEGLEAVDLRKQGQIARSAFDFLMRNGMLNHCARFDVVAVDGRTLECFHIMDAFESVIDY